MREKEVKRVMLARQPMYLLLPHDYCLLLLKKFEDVFLKEPLHGLSPLRGIEHQIDLIPRVFIPNRPTYIEVIWKRQKRAKDKWRA